MKIDREPYTLEVRSDLYFVGLTEDGEQYHAEGYYVHATLSDGTCYRTGWWPGCKVVRPDEEDSYTWDYFEDVRPEARAEADARLAQLEMFAQDFTGAAVDWQPTYPQYGSTAYEIETEEMTDEERSR